MGYRLEAVSGFVAVIEGLLGRLEEVHNGHRVSPHGPAGEKGVQVGNLTPGPTPSELWLGA